MRNLNLIVVAIISILAAVAPATAFAGEPTLEELARQVAELQAYKAELEALVAKLTFWASVVTAVAGILGWKVWDTIKSAPDMARKAVGEKLGDVTAQLAAAAGVIEQEARIHEMEILVVSPDGGRDVQIDLLNHGLKKVKVVKNLDPSSDKGDLVVFDVSRMKADEAVAVAEPFATDTWRSRVVVYYPTARGQLRFSNFAVFGEKVRMANNEDTLYMHVLNSLRRMVAFNEVI